MSSRAGKTLSARIIAPGATCTRLQDMCNARAYPRSQPVGRTLDPQSAPIQHVRVDHRGAHVTMPQQFLHGPDVVAVFEQVRGKRVPQRILTLPMNRLLRSFTTVTIPSTANT
jgi:hypothetical protein